MDCVSIVIPVYNTEPYLRECLKSVLGQTYQELELLLINDGSTDDSGEICRRFAEQDARVRYVETENQGVARARKYAASLATGKYLMFFDSDDWVDDDFVGEMMEQGGNADLVTSGYFKEEIRSERFFDLFEKGLYQGEAKSDIYRDMIYYKDTGQRGLTSYLANKRFRTDLARETFDEISEGVTIAEDSEFLYHYALKCESIRITDICGYHYRMRQGSATHAVDKRYLRNICEIYEGLSAAFENHPQNEELMRQLELWISRMLGWAAATMGFREEMWQIRFLLPFPETIRGKRVILFGAGRVGQDYRRLIRREKLAEIVQWIDSDAETREKSAGLLEAPEAIYMENVDFVVLATISEIFAEEMRVTLHQLTSFPDERILWEKPFRSTP